MNERWLVHTLVFDLDDTLYAERQFVHSGFAAVDAWLKSHYAVEGFYHAAETLHANGRRGRIFDEALEMLGFTATEKILPTMIDVYRAHRPTLHLFADADELLQWAASAGLRLALVTDGFAAVQRNKLHALDLHRRIECCVITDELGGRDFWKPSPEPFLRVMQLLPGDRAGFAYVADNPRKDFIAPRALGWSTIRIRRPVGEHVDYEATAAEDADKEILDLTELRALLLPANAW
jgi:putative hydrolase of the HAD superfamily